MRTETDPFGSKQIKEDALYGIQAARAVENFPGGDPFPEEWYRAMGDVKQSCYLAIGSLYSQADKYSGEIKKDIRRIPERELNAMLAASSEISAGEHLSQMIIPAVTGGAGTSINMNVNEIIANRALQIIGNKPGSYNQIDPYNDANCFQSTNDTVPTALKLALMRLLDRLEESVNRLRTAMESLEKRHFNHLRIGYTQMQEAVPTSAGRLFGSYNEAFSRDWWRITKAKERIKVINLGGSAVGTGLSVPRFFIFEAAARLKELTGQPLTRGDNLADATSNCDSFVEMHSMIKTLAVSMEKAASDIRLLGSDICGPNRLFSIPGVQVGSSIMPGKVNPVICEFVISNTRKVFANDQLISSLSAAGDLELNAYLPAIGSALIDSLKLLIHSADALEKRLLNRLQVNSEASKQALMHSPAAATALIPVTGYRLASTIAEKMKETGCSIFEASKLESGPNQTQIEDIFKPENLLSLGFSLKE